MLIDAVQSVGRFIKITAAKVHDQKFLKSLELISHSMIVFDKAYNYYHQFAQWTSNEVYFVTRMKKNAVYEVKKVTRVHYRKKVRRRSCGMRLSLWNTILRQMKAREIPRPCSHLN